MGLSKANGQPVNGLTVQAFKVSQIPPTRSDTVYERCGDSFTVDNIMQSWGGGVVAGCQPDRVMVHYHGWLTVPENQTLSFLLYSDDGGWVQVGDQQFGFWGDRSCWGSPVQVTLPAGVYPFDDWYYENGGGTCNYLYWSVDNAPWEVVSGFAMQEPQTTTTETSTTTTSTTTTTTLPETTTVPSTSTTLGPLPEPRTIPTTTESTQPPQSTTSTSSLPDSMTTQPAVVPTTTTSEPGNRSEPGGTTTISPTTSVRKPVETTTTVSPTTTTTVPFTTTTTLPAVSGTIPPSEAVAVATNADQVAALTPAQAAVVFASINENDLSPTEAAQLVAAVQHAPVKVRKQFEKKVWVFGGKFENYIPVGSRIPVRTRRIIIIGTVVIAATTIRRRKA